MPSLFKRAQGVTCYYCQCAVVSSPTSPFFASGSSSASIATFDPNFFRCPHCGCWNRYNERGEIVGDDPAMRDERLNVESFSKRGSPDRNHLPSTYSHTSSRGKGLFCHTCQTNQTLLVNLLSNYLPSPEDPSYNSRVAALPDYTASLQVRYPPVCASCRPAVEEEIARKDEMARTRALGGALKVSNRRGPGLVKGSSRASRGRPSLNSWRLRGLLWAGSLVVATAGNIAGILGRRPLTRVQFVMPVFPPLVLFSLAWTFWDPTYSLRQRSSIQGRQVRVEGRRTYIILQSFAWISRLITSVILFCLWLRPEWDFLNISNPDSGSILTRRKEFFGASLALEFTVIILSYFSITVREPAPIRLIDTSAHRGLSTFLESTPSSSTQSSFPPPYAPTPRLSSSASTISTMSEPDLFATLSLSSNPVITNYSASAATNPMFGKPSLSAPEPSQAMLSQKARSAPVQIPELGFENASLGNDDDDDEKDVGQRDPDAMDWEPASPVIKRSKTQQTKNQGDDGSWLRRQRFFPPEEPTGLENLLMRTRLIDEDEAFQGRPSAFNRPERGYISWGWVYSLSAFPVIALVAGLWLSGRLRS